MKITEKMVQAYLKNKSAVIVAEKENTVLVRTDSEYGCCFWTFLICDEKLYSTRCINISKEGNLSGIIEAYIVEWKRNWCEKDEFIDIYVPVMGKRFCLTTVCFFNKATASFEAVDVEPVSCKDGKFWCFNDGGKIGFGRTKSIKVPAPYDRRRKKTRNSTDIYLRKNGKLERVMEDFDMSYIASCYQLS